MDKEGCKTQTAEEQGKEAALPFVLEANNLTIPVVPAEICLLWNSTIAAGTD
jgi:hypothetical protein